AVVHLEKGMKRLAFVDLESADHPQTEEILVKSPRLFGITAAISIVVQPLDHRALPSLQALNATSLSFQCSRNSRPKPVLGVATRRGRAGATIEPTWLGYGLRNSFALKLWQGTAGWPIGRRAHGRVRDIREALTSTSTTMAAARKAPEPTMLPSS